jgi:hypothetical protein
MMARACRPSTASAAASHCSSCPRSWSPERRGAGMANAGAGAGATRLLVRLLFRAEQPPPSCCAHLRSSTRSPHGWPAARAAFTRAALGACAQRHRERRRRSVAVNAAAAQLAACCRAHAVRRGGGCWRAVRGRVVGGWMRAGGSIGRLNKQMASRASARDEEVTVNEAGGSAAGRTSSHSPSAFSPIHLLPHPLAPSNTPSVLPRPPRRPLSRSTVAGATLRSPPAACAPALAR